jgi:hypothetical protein
MGSEANPGALPNPGESATRQLVDHLLAVERANSGLGPPALQELQDQEDILPAPATSEGITAVLGSTIAANTSELELVAPGIDAPTCIERMIASLGPRAGIYSGITVGRALKSAVDNRMLPTETFEALFKAFRGDERVQAYSLAEEERPRWVYYVFPDGIDEDEVKTLQETERIVAALLARADANWNRRRFSNSDFIDYCAEIAHVIPGAHELLEDPHTAEIFKVLANYHIDTTYNNERRQRAAIRAGRVEKAQNVQSKISGTSKRAVRRRKPAPDKKLVSVSRPATESFLDPVSPLVAHVQTVSERLTKNGPCFVPFYQLWAETRATIGKRCDDPTFKELLTKAVRTCSGSKLFNLNRDGSRNICEMLPADEGDYSDFERRAERIRDVVVPQLVAHLKKYDISFITPDRCLETIRSQESLPVVFDSLVLACLEVYGYNREDGSFT